MRNSVGLLVAAVLVSGCGVAQHGIRIYESGTRTNKDGTTTTVSRLAVAINGDALNIKRAYSQTAGVEFSEGGAFNTSEVTRAQGVADKSRIDGVGAGVTGAILSTAVGPAIGAGGAAISAFAP